ncbi:TIR domain-containing protein [Spongiactinospora sp. TRM90649]|uniref:toll/interleukin-1 receptor domain-containing protein n=1 Tax=Spongiactinospora sp. TRM90649 TaxID=3031114 RepID=UPI0023F64CB9|nr:TIR domain-containing protein [Spongiactinospora sp. TRM90649]MDF5752180.1 TIR domain-containing protein [Spongiactinospora sp. TRM90649]
MPARVEGLGTAFAWLRSSLARRRRVRTDLGYGVFLSYSGERERRWLPHLQRVIEKQSRPWYRPPRLRVFLDYSGVSIGPQLWHKIKAGLARSDWLVVLASPESRDSVWVDREIEWWLEHKAVNNILLVVTAGRLVWDESRADWDPELSTALPARLLGRFEQQPVWKSVDLRHPDSDAGFPPDIDGVAFGIASVVRGLPEDELRSEGLADTKRNLRTARIVMAVLGLLLLVASTVSVIALASRAEATRQRDHAVAQQLIVQSSLLGDRDPFGARLKALAAWRIDPSAETRLAVLNASVDPRSGLLPHPWPVGAVAFSPDGRTIASGGGDGMVRFWDTATQQKAGNSLAGHNRGVTSVAFGPDGETLASSSFDGTVQLWDVARRIPIGAPLNAQDGMITSAVYSPDGRTLLTVGERAVRVWDVATHRRIGEPLGGSGGTSSVAFSPDGSTFASAFGAGVQLWDAGSRARIGGALGGADSSPNLVSFSPDGRILASAGHGVQLWDTTTRTPIGKSFASTSAGIESMTFSPDGAVLATGQVDGSVRLWDVVRHSQVGTPLIGHGSTVTAVAFSPDGSVLASSSDDTTVRLWDIRTQWQVGAPIDTGGTVALSPNGQILAMGSRANVRFLNVATRRWTGDPLVHGVDDGLTLMFSFSPNNAVLAVASRRIRLWDVAARRPIGKPLLLGDEVNALAFSPDGRTLASTSDSVRIWDLATHRQIGTALDVRATEVAFSPDGRTIVTDTANNTAALWDVATHRRLGETSADHTTQITAVAFSPDGETFATASRDSTVRLWDAVTRKKIGDPLNGHRSGVTAIAFSPDGRTLATGGMDHTVRLWDVTTGRQIGDPLAGHGADVVGLAFDPGGRTMASWGEDGTTRLWNVEATVDPVRSLCGWARGAFTPDRWRDNVPPGPESRPLCPSF